MSSDLQILQSAQDGMIEEINPLREHSLELKAKAAVQEIKSDQDLASAVAIKKQITAHRTFVKETRLGVTRRIDAVKDAVMAKEAEILLPLDEGQTDLSEKILTYQEEQERIKREERERIEKIVQRVTVGDVYKLKTVDDVQDEGERFKKMFKELKTEDQNLADVKVAFTQSINKLADRRQYLTEQAEQAKERERLAEEAKKQSAERQKIEAEKAKNAEKQRRIDAEKLRMEREKQRVADEAEAEKAKAAREAAEKKQVKTGVRTVTKFEIENEALVPREYCVPVDALIRAAIKEGKTVEGVRVWTEKAL